MLLAVPISANYRLILIIPALWLYFQEIDRARVPTEWLTIVVILVALLTSAHPLSYLSSGYFLGQLVNPPLIILLLVVISYIDREILTRDQSNGPKLMEVA